MILCWSRWRTVVVHHVASIVSTPSKGVVRFFEAAGGVPQVCRTDRMGALGQSQGRRFKLHPPTFEFARSSRHRDQGLPGRRRETQGQGRAAVPRAAGDVPAEELERHRRPRRARRAEPAGRSCGCDERVHRSPSPHDRCAAGGALRVERGFLAPLAATRGSTPTTSRPAGSQRALPFIEWTVVRYSVPPDVSGPARRGPPARSTATSCRGPLGRPASWPPTESATDGRSRCGTRRIAATAEAAALAVDQQPTPPSPRRPRHRERRAAPIERLEFGRRRLRCRRTGPRRPLRRPTRGAWPMSGRALRADQRRPRLPATGPGRRGLRHPRRAGPHRRLDPTSSSSPASSPNRPTPTRNRRLAARLRYARFPLPQDHRRLRLRVPAHRRPQTRRRPRHPAVHRPRTGPSCSSANPAAARPTSPSPSPPSPSRPATAATSPPPKRWPPTSPKPRPTAPSPSKLRTYTAPSVLVIDDVGLLPMPDRDAASAFFQVVNHRYEKRPPHDRHHQPRPARLGRDLRRRRRRLRHPRPAHAQRRRVQHQRPLLAAPRTPRPRDRHHPTPLTSPPPGHPDHATRISLIAERDFR